MLPLTFLTFSFVYAYYHFETASSIPSSEQELEVKWNYYGKIRRFTVRSDKVSIYEELRKTLHLYEPAFQGILTWKDNENDSVLLNSSNELSLALKYKANKFLRLILSLCGKVFVKQLFDNKEIKIFDTDLPQGGEELQLSKQLAKTQSICPIVILNNYKHEDGKIRTYKNKTNEKETMETTRKIIQ